jgi:beta-lactamase superfamily II metal-dependent hydrolase
MATSDIPVGAILINEFVPASKTAFAQEKIELYNATPDPADISGLGIDDIASGGTWTPDTFEIHVFDVGQGDSQLVVSPSGKTLLIDVREPSWRSVQGATYIAGKLREVMGPFFSHIDYIMASHLHLDHIGYAGYGGIWGLLETQGFTVGKLIDRDAGIWVDSNGDGICNPDTEIEWHNAGTTSGTARNWLCYATDPANAAKLNREIAVINSTTQIDLGPDVTVKIVQRDAEDVMMADGATPVGGDHTADAFPPSENDYSIGVKITFGLLDYATAGDSGGEYSTSQFGYTYNDVEAVLAPRMGVVDVMRANHHGSGHSTSQLYADTLQPQASFISCGNNPYGQPGQTTLDRLLYWGVVYLTNLCDPTRNYGASVVVNGDIVLKSTDGVNFMINGTPFIVTHLANPTPTATNPPSLTTARPSTPTITADRLAPRQRFAFPLSAPVPVTSAEELLIENEPGPLYVILSTVDEHGVEGEPTLDLMSQPDSADTTAVSVVSTGTFAQVMEIRRHPPNYLRTFYRVRVHQSASQDIEGWVADWYVRRTASVVLFDEEGCACPFQVQLWADKELTQPADPVLNRSSLRLLTLSEKSVQVQVLSNGAIGWISRDEVRSQ